MIKGHGNTMDLNSLDIEVDVCNVNLCMLAIWLSSRRKKPGGMRCDHVLPFECTQTCTLMAGFMPENEHLCLCSVNSRLVNWFVLLFSPLYLVIVD